MGVFYTTLFIQGCTILQGVLLARMLGPVGRGEMSIVILWPTIFAAIGILGVNSALARYSAKHGYETGIFKTALFASLMTGILTLLMCDLSVGVLLPVEKHYLLDACYLFAFFIPINHLALNIQGIDHGVGNFFWFNLTRGILYPVYFIGLIIVWLCADKDLLLVIGALLFANASVVFVRSKVIAQALLNFEKGPPLKSFFTAGAPFLIANIIGTLYAHTDKALVVWFLKSEEIGVYVAAFAAASTLSVFGNAIGISQFTAAAQCTPRFGFAALGINFRRCMLVTTVAGIFLSGLIPWLLPIVYGRNFKDAVPVALILIPGMVFSGLSDIVTQSMRGQNRPIIASTTKIAGLIVMTVLSLFLVKFIGGKGVAVAFVIGEAVSLSGLLLLSYFHYKDSSLKIFRPKIEDVKFLLNRFVGEV